MERPAHLAHLRADGEALADAAQRAPSVRIPSCPDWDMTLLVTHTGTVHRWVDEIVSTRSAKYVKWHAPQAMGPDARLDWYREGLEHLLATLAEVDPEVAVWNWFDRGVGPTRFWIRRMAQETAVHRWDGEAGAGDPQPIAADLAVDGIDEFLEFANQILADEPVARLEGSLHLHATDTDGEWSIEVRPDHLTSQRAHTKADAALRGPASDLLLWMLNRIPADASTLQAFGDAALIERWRQVRFS